jgi:hypothetical protein
VVTRLNAGYPRPYRFDNSSTFVARHNWRGMLGRPGHQMPVAVTYARCSYFDQNFTRSRWFENKGLDFKRHANFVEDSRLDFHE